MFVVLFCVITLCSAPDFDNDNDVDQSDFGQLQSCLNSIDPECSYADLNDDNLINNQDIDLFIKCSSGSNVPYDINCLEKKMSQTLYVSKSGDDGNIGSSTLPKLTVQGAIDAITGNPVTINITSGIYEEGNGIASWSLVLPTGLSNELPKG